MSSIDWLSANPAVFYAYISLIGLLIGSFLNVVIYRLPVMMKREWGHECREFLALEQPDDAQEPFNLITPRSRCPQCKTPIRAWQNIPVLSYLWQRGRCSNCGTGISLQYPMIEMLTALVSLAAALSFGVSVELIFALGFSWALIALSGIDINTQLLPDSIVFPLLWAGLLINSGGYFTSLSSAVFGAATGYLILWSVFQLFRLITGKEGMGFGDFKLLAALGAWAGLHSLPFIILLSSLLGAIVGIALMLTSRIQRDNPIPFGPYLAVAGWVALIYADEVDALTESYLALF